MASWPLDWTLSRNWLWLLGWSLAFGFGHRLMLALAFGTLDYSLALSKRTGHAMDGRSEAHGWSGIGEAMGSSTFD